MVVTMVGDERTEAEILSMHSMMMIRSPERFRIEVKREAASL